MGTPQSNVRTVCGVLSIYLSLDSHKVKIFSSLTWYLYSFEPDMEERGTITGTHSTVSCVGFKGIPIPNSSFSSLIVLFHIHTKRSYVKQQLLSIGTRLLL